MNPLYTFVSEFSEDPDLWLGKEINLSFWDLNSWLESNGLVLCFQQHPLGLLFYEYLYEGYLLVEYQSPGGMVQK